MNFTRVSRPEPIEWPGFPNLGDISLPSISVPEWLSVDVVYVVESTGVVVGHMFLIGGTIVSIALLAQSFIE